MADVLLETERLVFRTERPGDLAVWLEHMNTPQVMAALGGVRSREEIEQSFAQMAAAAGSALTFSFLERKSDGLLIGKCGLSPIETAAAPAALQGAVQTGWSLRADMWGQGYAREAAGGALRQAFDVLDLEIVYAQTSERNVASWRLMERLGMKRRAELDYVDPDYPDEDNPTMVWSIAREDWQRSAGSADD